MNPFRWIGRLILPPKPSREDIALARRGILSELDASIRALHQVPPSPKNQKTITQLEQLRKELRKDFVEVIQLRRSAENRPVRGKKGPVHTAAMRTSHQLNIMQAEARINRTAWKARQLIEKNNRMHALRTRPRGRVRR